MSHIKNMISQITVINFENFIFASPKDNSVTVVLLKNFTRTLIKPKFLIFPTMVRIDSSTLLPLW